MFWENGLEYEMLIVNLLTRPILPRIEEVKQYLIYYENRLEHNHCSPMIDYSSNLGSVSANLVANEVQKYSPNAKSGN